MIKKSTKKGFSLVELLVVITIIAILSVVAYTAVAGNTVKARDARRKQDLATLQQALEVYYVQNAKYPASPLKSGTVIAAGEIPKSVLSDISVDPGTAKHSYQYKVSGTTYQIGATLENDGQVANYESYVVGNSDTPLLNTTDGLGKYNNSGTIGTCDVGLLIGPGKIQTTKDDPYNPGPVPPASSCVPYDPLN